MADSLQCGCGTNRLGNFLKKQLHCIVTTCSLSFTGTFIALDQLIRILEDPEKSEIDIFNMVYQLRKDRRYLVQTLAQYTFLYRCLYEYCKANMIHTDSS